MPGNEAIDRHEYPNIVPLPDRHIADNLPQDSSPRPKLVIPRNPMAEEVVAHLQHVRRHELQARECFPSRDEHGRTHPSIKPKVMHEGVARRLDSLYVATDYYEGEGVDRSELDVLFSDRGNWRYERDIPEIYSFSAMALNGMLRKELGPVNNIIDRALDGLAPDGFNKHGEDHPDFTVDVGLSLLERVDDANPQVNESRKRNLVIAGQGHDIGNFFGRDAHPHISPLMLEAIFPSVAADPEHWRTIRRAIILHDSDNLQAVMDSWGPLSSNERLDRLATLMKPEGLALLIADKADVRIERASNKVLAEEIIKDPHAVVNALGCTQALEHDGDAFVWRIDYDPDLTTKQMEKFKHFAPGLKERREKGEVTISCDDWINMFLGIYTDRIITASQASLALFPVRSFEIQIANFPQRELRETIKFSRDSLDADITTLRDRQRQLKKAGVLKYRQ